MDIFLEYLHLFEREEQYLLVIDIETEIISELSWIPKYGHTNVYHPR